MDTKQLMERLLKLQDLEFDETDLGDAAEKQREKKIEALRLQIPLPVLNHYDRLRVRGKKGVAGVRHQTCTGCHVQVTRAMVISLMHADDLHPCENCGRYLYLLPEPAVEETVPDKKTAAKFRKAELACAA